jgi:hypothetical protein
LFPGGKNPIVEPEEPRGYAHTCLVVDDLTATLAHLADWGLCLRSRRVGRAGQRWRSSPTRTAIAGVMAVPPDSPLYRPA